MELLDYLRFAVEARASDLFIVAGGPVCVKLEKRMTPVGGERVFPQETERLIMALYQQAQRSPDRFLSRGDDDFSFSVGGLARFRVNTYRQRGSLAAVVRVVAFDIPSFAVDTHVDRISKRLGLARPQDSVEKVEEKLKRKISRDLWNRAHHEMIFFGRYFCTARNPRCADCPFGRICRKEKLEVWKQAEKKRLKSQRDTNG